jgi:WD40 repeat protein
MAQRGMGTTAKAKRDLQSPGAEGQTLADGSKTLADSGSAADRAVSRSPVQVPDHELLTRIGQGSYGEVWLARNVMGTYRAVKIVYRAAFEHARPFEREFNGIQKFEPISRSHDGFVDVLQIGRTPDLFYYVMELADDVVIGQQIDPATYEPKTLRSQVQAHKPLPFEQCVELGISLTAALTHLHEHGLIHRDIKPSNIIFVNGIPKLADIGLVAEQSEARSFVGTEGFIPPEGPGTPQADIYSLGKVLYEIATGKDRHEFPALPTLLGESGTDSHLLELNSVFLKACQADLKQRYQTGFQMREDLLLLRSGKSVKRAQALERRLALAWRSSLIGALITILAAAGLVYSRRQALREAGLRRDAELAKRSAETSKQATLQLLIKSHIETGAKLAKKGEVISALPWWLEALRLETDPARAEMHRIRLSTALRQSPKPTFVWFHADEVRDIDLSGDGTLAATASRDKTARVWSMETGEPVTPWLRHSNTVEQVRISHDGKLLLTRETWKNPIFAWELPDEGTGTISLWDVGTGERLIRQKFTTVISYAEFSPDDQWMAAACSDGMARLWAPGTHALVRELKHPRDVLHVAFNPDSTLLATCCKDGQVRLWDLATGRELRKWDITSSTIATGLWQMEALFSPDGQRLMAINATRARAWLTNSSEAAFTLAKPTDGIISARFDPAGTHILTSTLEGEIDVWNASDGVHLVSIHGLEHHASTPDFKAAFSPGGDFIFAAPREGARFWDTIHGLGLPLNIPISGGVSLAKLSPNGHQLVLACRDGTARVWDLISTAEGTARYEFGRIMTKIRVSKDGQRLYIGSASSKIWFWDVARAQPLIEDAPQLQPGPWGANELELRDDDKFLFAADLNGRAQVFNAYTGQPAGPPLHHGLTNGVVGTFTDQPDTVVTGDEHGVVRLWNFVSGQLLAQATPTNTPIGQVLRIPGKGWVASATADNTVRFWRSRTLEPVGKPLSQEGAFSFIAVNADGKLLAVGSNEIGGVDVWDLDTGTVKWRWSTPSAINWLSFDPLGRWLAATCDDFTLRTWDLATGRMHLNLPTGNGVGRFMFSNDGALIAATGNLGAQVWDAKTGELVSPPLRQNQYYTFVNDLQFMPDGRGVAGGGSPEAAQIWNLAPEPFTVEQWSTLCQAISGQKVGDRGALEPLPMTQFSNAWQLARMQHPLAFTNSDEAICRWIQVRPSERRSAALWKTLRRHLDPAIERNPTDPSLKKWRTVAALHLGDLHQAAQDNPSFAVLPRDPCATAHQIDLTAFYNRSLAKDGLGVADVDWAELPQGLQQFGGTLFDLRGFIGISGHCPDGPDYPKAVTHIPVKTRGRFIHVLHFTSFECNDGIKVGAYLLRYANGQTAEFPVEYGRDVRNWWTVDGEPAVTPSAAVVWVGSTPGAAASGRTIRLWKRTYVNPVPEFDIAEMDFVSAMAYPAPALMAVTIDDEPP